MNPILPLRLLIPLLLLLSAGLAGLVSILYLSPQVEEKVEEDSVRGVRAVMNLLHSSISLLLHRNDSNGVRIQLTSLATDNHTITALLVDDQGKVLVSAYKNQQGKIIDEVTPFLTSSKLSQFLKINNNYVSLSENKRTVHAVYPINLSDQDNSLRPRRTGFLVFEKNIGHEKLIEKRV